MTAREAIIQAHMELGKSREEAERSANYADGCVPLAAMASQCPVRPGMEREFIESLKQIFGRMGRNPEAWKAAIARETARRMRRN